MSGSYKEYKPTQAQRLAKARLYKHLSENLSVRIEDMSVETMGHVARARNLTEWMQKEGFADWWLERSVAGLKIAAGIESAVDRLIEIINTPPEETGPKARVSTKDILSAADKLFNLADLYPKKRVERVFMDKQIEAMDAEETREATKQLEAKLAPEKKELDK